MKKKTLLIILYLLLIALIIFIWARSSQNAAVSTDESLAVGSFLQPFLELFVGKGNVTDTLVRKIAHFCEFGLLGVIMGLILVVKQRSKLFNIAYITLCCMAVAVIDETIQLFSEGRSAQVTDVLLDTSGAIVGIVGIILIALIVKLIKKRR